MGKHNRGTATPKPPNTSNSQLSRGIPELFKASSQDHRMVTRPSPARSSSSMSEGDGEVYVRSRLNSSKDLTPRIQDLHSMAEDIKLTFTEALAGLKTDLRAIVSRVGDIEAKTIQHTRDLRRTQDVISEHTNALISLKHQLEDLDNKSRRKNIRLRGLPESVDPTHMETIVRAIFNAALNRPPESPMDIERVHRALRPKMRDTDPPRDVVCCMGNTALKEEITRAVRDGGRLRYEETDLQLFQDLATFTLLQRKAFRPLLTALRAKGATYKWRFPFGLEASFQDKVSIIRHPEDILPLCSTMDIPPIDLPDWLDLLGIGEPQHPSAEGTSPQLQNPRRQRSRSSSANRNRGGEDSPRRRRRR